MRQMDNNRGFSLIELIVAMAVLVVIGGCIYGFVSTSTKTYNSVSQDVDLQEEAQLAMNQLESIVMNAQDGVSYDEDKKTLYIYNDEECYKVAKGDSAASQDVNSLYYSILPRSKDPNTGEYVNGFDPATEEPALMAEYLTDFVVKLEKSDKTDSVVAATISMQFDKAKKSYTATQKIALRNNAVKLSSDLETVYAEDTGSSTLTPIYSGIRVNLGGNNFTTATANTTGIVLTDSGDVVLALSYEVVGSNRPSNICLTSLTGSSVKDGAEPSRVEGGSVIISKDEEASALTLSVVAAGWPSLQCLIQINIKKILGITIGSNISNPEAAFRLGSEITLGKSATSQLYATVTGTGNLSDADMEYTWEAGENCTVSGNKLTITTDESKVGQNFTVTARAKSGKTDTFSGTITARSTYLFLSADAKSVDRGDSVQFTATDGSEEYPQKDVTYSCSVSGGASSSLVSISQSGTLSVSKNLDYSKEYTITVTAALSYKTDVTRTVTITVPAVGVQYALEQDGVYVDNFTVPMRNLTTEDGKNLYTLYYKVTGLKDGTLADIEWSGDSSKYFGATTKIGASTITFKKTNRDYDGENKNYTYSQFYSLEGIPLVGETKISSAKITVNNNQWSTNITIRKNNSDTSYYIPVVETKGSVTLAGTDIVYSVMAVNDSWNTYYLLTISAPDSVQNKKYKANTWSGWGVVY
jgi:prepilin-type N-terminal cleavage/methylation domain-containing protein